MTSETIKSALEQIAEPGALAAALWGKAAGGDLAAIREVAAILSPGGAETEQVVIVDDVPEPVLNA